MPKMSQRVPFIKPKIRLAQTNLLDEKQKMMLLKAYKDDYGSHLRIRIFSLNLEIQLYRTHRTTGTLGIRNNTPDGKRLLFMDYDEHLLEFIEPEIKHLQKTYGLSDFYIFKSSLKPNGFHAICLDKLRYKEFINIINQSSCDEYYRKMPITTDHHSWVLRSLKKEGSIKPKLVKIIKSKHQEREKSLAHYLYLKHQHNIKNKPKKLDKNKILYTIQYGTMNYIKADELKK